MAIDSSIALQGSNPLKMIGDLQGLDRQRMENQKFKATMAADIARNQAESDVSTGTVQPRISQQESTASEAKVGLGEHYQKLISGVTSQIAADPTVQAASKPDATKEQKDKASRRASDLLHIGIGGATVMGVPQDVIKGHIQPLLDMAESNPGELYQAAANHQIQSMTPSERTANVFPAASTLNTGSQTLPVQGGNQAFTGKAPLSPVGAPIANEIAPQVVQTPQGPGIFQNGNIGQMGYGGDQPQPSAMPQGPNMNTPSHSQRVALPYPAPVAGQVRPQLPSEEPDRVTGQTYRTQLLSRQPQLATERRNIDEVISEAQKLEDSMLPTSGALGSATRALRTWAGDPTYTMLSKDLANSTISNMKALGLNTDADKTLISAANGDYTYPPKVLIQIAQRAKGDMANIDMQAQAAQSFAQKFGDSNMGAFKQMWAKNADSKVFQALAITQSDADPAKVKKQVNELMGNNPEARKAFLQKYQNIKKMVSEGSL